MGKGARCLLVELHCRWPCIWPVTAIVRQVSMNHFPHFINVTPVWKMSSTITGNVKSLHLPFQEWISPAVHHPRVCQHWQLSPPEATQQSWSVQISFTEKNVSFSGYHCLKVWLNNRSKCVFSPAEQEMSFSHIQLECSGSAQKQRLVL